MDDVSAMAINQGLTKRGKDRTTLQALCKDQGCYLKKTQHVRVGICFASTKGSLSKDALTYLKIYKRSGPSSAGVVINLVLSRNLNKET